MDARPAITFANQLSHHNWLDVNPRVQDLVILEAMKVSALVSAFLRIPPPLFLSVFWKKYS